MLQQDYLMRMILQLIEAIMKSLEPSRGAAPDPEASADLLEAAIGTATDIDGATSAVARARIGGGEHPAGVGHRPARG